MNVMRDIYQSVINDLLQFPAVAILGPRQVGKTMLAKSIINVRQDALYLDLERPSDLAKLQDAETYLSLYQDKLICIDEVQLRPDLFPLLRSLIDENKRPGRFLLLGSSSPDLLRQSSETLAGRLSYIYVTPFHQQELRQAGVDISDWARSIWRGGFPDSYLAASDQRSFRWRESYIQTFVERDLRQFGIDLNPQHMRRLWLMCAHIHGQVVNYSKLGQSLDLTHPTVKRHLDIFESTFMLRRLAPFEVNIKKRLVKSPKLYLRDSGILTALLDLESFDSLYAHPVYGSCWEGFALENILAMLKPRGRYGFFRTHGGDGIDLIIEHKRRRLGFEFKASSSPKLNVRHMNVAEWLELDQLFIVVPKGDAYPVSGERIWVVPLTVLPEHIL